MTSSTNLLPPDIIRTKLHLPTPRSSLVPRPRLIHVLSEGLSRPLTLISAPTGYGKTTLLSEWLYHDREDRDGHAGEHAAARSTLELQPSRVAWVSLDEQDNDSVRFWTYVVAALQNHVPVLGENVLTLLQSPQPADIQGVLTVLVNELDAFPDPLALVLDDYHVIESRPIHEGLAFLLSHLPPRMHLIILSRVDPPLPLARLRARDALVEVRAADLRFTPEEAADFFNQVMGLQLAPQDIAALDARTEGWVAGLQLAALSMRGRTDISSFVAAFTGSHRFVLDYLAEQVLQRQPESVQTFLLQTSILDRMTAGLCDAVTGRQDGGQVLEQLERLNLFLVPLDEERQWYRYHHLFADVLRSRLYSVSRDQAPELVRRASAWCEAHDLDGEAIQYALAAHDFGRAGALIWCNAEAMWMRGQLGTLEYWLEAIPQEELHAQPRPLLVYAFTRFLQDSHQLEPIEALLKRAESALEAQPAQMDGANRDGSRAELEAILVSIRAAIACMREDRPRTLELSERALQELPPGRLFWRIDASLNRGVINEFAGEVQAAGEALNETIALCRASGNMLTELLALFHLARVRGMQGELGAAVETCQEGINLAARHGAKRIRLLGNIYLYQARMYYSQNRLSEALESVSEGLARLVPNGEELAGMLDGYVTLARIKRARGDTAGVADLAARAEELGKAADSPRSTYIVETEKARLWLLHGDLERAARWLVPNGARPGEPLNPMREYRDVTLARLLVAGRQEAQALELLGHLRRAAERAGRIGSAIDILVIEAIAQWQLGESETALQAMAQALNLAAPRGFLRVFMDETAVMHEMLPRVRARLGGTPSVEAFVSSLPQESGSRAEERVEERVSNSMPAPAERTLVGARPLAQPVTPTTPRRAQPLVEPLSERELQVLRLVAAGESNREIADQLVVAVSTVKRHISNIYGKLDVSSRTQALARARDLGLL